MTDAKTVYAADPDPSGSERTQLAHPMTDGQRAEFGAGLERIADDTRQMDAAAIERRLNDLKDSALIEGEATH